MLSKPVGDPSGGVLSIFVGPRRSIFATLGHRLKAQLVKHFTVDPCEAYVTSPFAVLHHSINPLTVHLLYYSLGSQPSHHARPAYLLHPFSFHLLPRPFSHILLHLHLLHLHKTNFRLFRLLKIIFFFGFLPFLFFKHSFSLASINSQFLKKNSLPRVILHRPSPGGKREK